MCEIESACALLVEERSDALFLLRFGLAAQIHLAPRKLDRALDDLERLPVRTDREGRTQYGVARYQRFPCSPELVRPQRTPQLEAPFLEPHSRGHRVHRVEETLHRRERIDILERRVSLEQAVERRLVERDEREVRRRLPRRGGRSAVRDDRSQRFDERVGETRDRVLLVQRVAEDELRLESTVANERHQLEGVPTRRLRVVPRP